MTIKVAVLGARGRMGAEVCRAVEAAADLEPVGGPRRRGRPRRPRLADVAVDFTHPDAVLDNLSWCIETGSAVVVGTTGFTEERLGPLERLARPPPQRRRRRRRELLRRRHPDDALRRAGGRVLRERRDHRAAPPGKADAPSGTATTTARAHRRGPGRGRAGSTARCDRARGSRGPGRRGRRHRGARVRLRGLVAHQEVLFGAEGETLTIRHDSLDRVVVHARRARRRARAARGPG